MGARAREPPGGSVGTPGPEEAACKGSSPYRKGLVQEGSFVEGTVILQSFP